MQEQQLRSQVFPTQEYSMEMLSISEDFVQHKESRGVCCTNTCHMPLLTNQPQEHVSEFSLLIDSFTFFTFFSPNLSPFFHFFNGITTIFSPFVLQFFHWQKNFHTKFSPTEKS